MLEYVELKPIHNLVLQTFHAKLTEPHQFLMTNAI